MEMTEFSEFGIRRRTSEPNEIKAPITFILMEIANAQLMAKCEQEIKGTESFRVISKESPITELK